MNNRYEGSVLRLFSPSSVLNAIFFVYLLPVLYLQFSGGYFLSGIYPVKLVDPVIVLAIFFVNLLALNVVSSLCGCVKWPLIKVVESPVALSYLVVFLWGLISFFSINYLVLELDLIKLFISIFSDPVYYFLEQPKVGVRLSEGGHLKYFLLSQFSIVSLYVLWKLVLPRRTFVKFLFLFALVFLVVLFYLISRREVIVFIFVVLSLEFFRDKSVLAFSKYLIPLSFVMISIVGIRTGSDNLLDLSGFFSSQEFYPFQVGAVALDKWMSDLSLRSPMELLPFNIFYADFSLLSVSTMEKNFAFVGHGPTVSINYALWVYGFFPVLFCFALAMLLTEFVYRQAFGARSGFVWLPVYAWLVIKLLLLVRNGEFVNYFVDVFLFLVLYLPFIVCAPRRARGAL